MSHHQVSLRTQLAPALLALLVVFAPLAVCAQESSAPEITFESAELANGLYMIMGVGGFAGGNIGLLTGADGVILVDDSFPPFTERQVEAVAEVASAPVDFVINTHVHGDHMGGNAMLGGQGAHILAHDNVRSRLVDEGMPTGTGESIPAPPEALPVMTFGDAVTFHLNGHTAHVFHVVEAHTDGDAVIHFSEADVIHTGDVFFHQVFPFIDLDSGGSVDGYIAAQEMILEKAGDATRIIPGHGPQATAKDLAASVAMLKTIRQRMQAMIDDGKTVDDLLTSDVLDGYEGQSWQFITSERMVRQMHRGLAAE